MYVLHFMSLVFSARDSGFHISSISSSSTIFLIKRGSSGCLDLKIDLLFFSLHFTVGISYEDRVSSNTSCIVENVSVRLLLTALDRRRRNNIQPIIFSPFPPPTVWVSEAMISFFFQRSFTSKWRGAMWNIGTLKHETVNREKQNLVPCAGQHVWAGQRVWGKSLFSFKLKNERLYIF